MMMIGDILAATFAILASVVMLLLIFKKGIYGTFQMLSEWLETMVRRIVYGPQERKIYQSYTGKDTCKILHLNAKTEMTMYGMLLSDSVIDHVKSCIKHSSIFLYPRLSPRPPRPTNSECKHKGTLRDESEMDGTKHVYCTVCDYYKRIPYPQLPDTARMERR